MLRLKIYGVTPSLPHMSLWHVQRWLYLCFLLICIAVYTFLYQLSWTQACCMCCWLAVLLNCLILNNFKNLITYSKFKMAATLFLLEASLHLPSLISTCRVRILNVSLKFVITSFFFKYGKKVCSTLSKFLSLLTRFDQNKLVTAVCVKSYRYELKILFSFQNFCITSYCKLQAVKHKTFVIK
jgi:hypothetical protein